MIMDKSPKNLSIIIALLIAIVGGSIVAKNILEGKTASTTASKEQQLVVLINNYRKTHHLKALTINPGLSSAAREHSQDMLDKGYFDHRGFPQRVRKYRNANYVGENIAWGTGGYGDPSGVLSLWRSSPEHNKIMLTARFSHVGVGMISGTFSNQRNAVVTTADFSN